jgi:hypothetical protein
MKELRPTKIFCVCGRKSGNWKARFFAPHGWWARFATNVLKKPNWAYKRRYTIAVFDGPFGFPRIPKGSNAETEAALDKIKDQLASNANS